MRTKQDVGKMMREYDCGCSYHLEGNDEQCLIVKVFLHLEAAHPEIEKPTVELAEELVVMRTYERTVSGTQSSRYSL